MSLNIFRNKIYQGQVVNIQSMGNLENRDDDRYEAHRYYYGRSLTDVTYDSLIHEYGPGWWSGHNFLLAEAFVFFLPALVNIASTKYEQNRVDQMADSLVLNLWSMSFDEDNQKTKIALEHYSGEQLGFFSQFLHKMAHDRYAVSGDQDNATPALTRFWGRYLPDNKPPE